jgi:hypothetical protein
MGSVSKRPAKPRQPLFRQWQPGDGGDTKFEPGVGQVALTRTEYEQDRNTPTKETSLV